MLVVVKSKKAMRGGEMKMLFDMYNIIGIEADG